MHRFESRDQDSQEGIDEEVLEEARLEAKKKVGFYKHVASWAIVSVFLGLLNLYSGTPLWFVIPVLGWGIAIAFHASSVFLGFGFQRKLEEKEVERILKRRRG